MPASSSKPTAAGGSGVGPSRRTFTADAAPASTSSPTAEPSWLAEENARRARDGRAPLKLHPRDAALPAPTSTLQARTAPLDLDKNVGKTLMVDGGDDDAGGRRRGGPGYYCELCNRTAKDSIGYLDHINGRSHLLRLGQSTRVQRATPREVREHIEVLLLKHKEKDKARGREYDFKARVQAIKAEEARRREERKERRRGNKSKRRADQPAAQAQAQGDDAPDAAMMQMMGFGGFGSSKK